MDLLSVIRRWRFRDEKVPFPAITGVGSPSVREVGSSKLGFVRYLARLHAKMLEVDEKITKLEQELRVERASLAQRYPDRAPALVEEQKAVERKIQRTFDPNQVPPNGMGF